MGACYSDRVGPQAPALVRDLWTRTDLTWTNLQETFAPRRRPRSAAIPPASAVGALSVLASGPRVQPIDIDGMGLTVVRLGHAQHMHELPSEPSRHKQGCDRHD